MFEGVLVQREGVSCCSVCPPKQQNMVYFEKRIFRSSSIVESFVASLQKFLKGIS